jgi:ribosomal protein S17
MKKQFVVTNVETVAWDDHIITMKAPDATIKLHLHDQLEHNQSKIGDELEIDLPVESAKPAKKAPAKKAKAPKAPVV